MNPTPYQIAALVRKYLQNKLTDEESRVFQRWLDESPHNEKIVASFRGDQSTQDITYLAGLDVEAGWERLRERRRRRRFKNIIRYAGAAAAVVLIAFSWIMFSTKSPESEPIQIATSTNRYANDVLPGGSKAKLKLSDGRYIDLEAYASGMREQDGTRITGGEGELTYSNTTQVAEKVIYNTLVVPKAGMYNLTLSDGTKVWVNASSELRFPVVFDGNERTVYLEGEAYFDVTRDTSRPFRVNVGGTTIEVLGTEFNVNSYKQTSATLISGSVKMYNKTGEKLLKPGQEGKVGAGITVHEADIEKAVAWKQGDFFFRSDNIEEIMDQLSRWYDLEVVYEGAIPAEAGYNGGIQRSANLSEVLEMLSYVSGTQFEVAGNKVIVRFK